MDNINVNSLRQLESDLRSVDDVTIRYNRKVVANGVESYQEIAFSGYNDFRIVILRELEGDAPVVIPLSEVVSIRTVDQRAMYSADWLLEGDTWSREGQILARQAPDDWGLPPDEDDSFEGSSHQRWA